MEAGTQDGTFTQVGPQGTTQASMQVEFRAWHQRHLAELASSACEGCSTCSNHGAYAVYRVYSTCKDYSPHGVHCVCNEVQQCT